MSLSLDTIPQEVLEHIAFFTATQSFLGPPSSLIPLLNTNRRINTRLSIIANKSLYARIFVFKFDVGAPVARFGSVRLSASALSHELQRRFELFHRIRGRSDAKSVNLTDGDGLSDLLLHAYLIMLENEGKNERQLKDYAKMGDWLREFWFDEQGASKSIVHIRSGKWPPNSRTTALAMWLFWFLLTPSDYMIIDGPESPINILKIHASAAHIYNLSTLPCTNFEAKASSKPADSISYYLDCFELSPLPLAMPAILAFLALMNTSRSVPLPPTDPAIHFKPSSEWDCEWRRGLILGQGRANTDVTTCFEPGSLEGVWEGFFTYTEFTSYVELLHGAPPQIFHRSALGRHQHTWKLREHHLVNQDLCFALPAGDPLSSFFPTDTHIREHPDGLLVSEPGRKVPIHYQRSTRGQPGIKSSVQDVIVTGEGHSAWGQFNIIGRVRPYDGFISLSKAYVEDGRGRWLYCGYLVGNGNGNFAGRWRDTVSAIDSPGYEGCFAMSRRRCTNYGGPNATRGNYFRYRFHAGTRFSVDRPCGLVMSCRGATVS